MKSYFKKITLFVLIGLALYAAAYFASEQFVFKYGRANPFFKIRMAKQSIYDYVILGASHPMPFDYKDMNSRLEEIMGAKVINLATAGNGILPNRFIFEYFLSQHEARNLLYFIDSFAFYSKAWNEERFKDVQLFQRAPLDLTLAKMLFSYTFQEGISYSISVDYISGFSKINNRNRFKPDIQEDESRFDRKYTFIRSRDLQRIKYLYPEGKVNEASFKKYLSKFIDFIDFLKGQGVNLIVLKTPIPTHIYKMIPQEKEFDEKIIEILQKKEVPFYDFSLVDNQKEYFYDTDHLNRTGVLNFFNSHLKPALLKHGKQG